MHELDLSFDVACFLVLFPEFTCFQEFIQGVAETVIVETDGYCGLKPQKAKLAIQYHTAHYLWLQNNATQGYGGVIKSIKSRHDEIEFGTGSNADPFGLESSSYGQRLKRLLKKSYKGGCVARSNISQRLYGLSPKY